MFDFRTDLADERTEICKENIKNKSKKNKKNIIDGIKTKEEKITNNLSINKVQVINEKGSKLIGKKIGNYITIDIKDLDIVTEEDINNIKEIFTKELKGLIKNKGSILVVGLGNEDTTADSIGPKVVKDLEITRHILKYKPELLPKDTREVCAIVPGVLGTTGIETQEIIKGIVEKIDISVVIVIDALASNNIGRLLKTIQICDTGITPGAGVNNKRKEISFETIGIPVIAIGVPTVVEAATIVADTFKILEEQFEEFNFLKNSDYEDKYKLIKMVLQPSNYNLAVMPKEIDDLVDNMKEIISFGINHALN